MFCCAVADRVVGLSLLRLLSVPCSGLDLLPLQEVLAHPTVQSALQDILRLRKHKQVLKREVLSLQQKIKIQMREEQRV